ncbi:MAG: GTP cyclohydrolase II [Alphaproteobacteria bacterium]|nr:GTP cyclohydrolase II [Alphaproteobacteria bacterium]
MPSLAFRIDDPSRTTGHSIVRVIERAIGDLRRSVPVILTVTDGHSLLVVPAETATDAALTLLRRHGQRVRLVVGTEPRALPVPERASADWVLARAEEVAGPSLEPQPGDADAVTLVKHARLLPSAVVATLTQDAAPITAAEGLLLITAEQVQAFKLALANALVRVSEARVPLKHAEDTRIIAFRPTDGDDEHLAIVIGTPDPTEPVLARVHSSCVTGDVLGSLRCDCGEQLQGAVATIAAAGGGVVLYLNQEGRGIGIANKLRAYRIQDTGVDTVDANLALGFEADERDYGLAAAMLRDLGYASVRLLTNNPEKLAQLARHGVTVVERVAHSFEENVHNAAYLDAKRKKSGHMI